MSKTYDALRDARKEGFRAVSTPRKRKLVKRGEYVFWSYRFHCWLWESSILANNT